MLSCRMMNLLWFVGLLFFAPAPLRSFDLLCFPYVLENECSSLVGNVSIVEESEQQDFFDEYVSLNVSNVRMVQESCRRPYLSYLCQLMFGSFSCESSSNEEQHCLEEQYCLQVSDLCSDYFQLDCSSSFSSSPSPTPTPTLDCSEEVKEQIEEVKKKPIQVETCLDGLKEEIECCLDPFIFDDNDECVVQCPQYLYGDSVEQWIRIISFILAWFSILIFAASVIPLSLMTDLSYPKYLIFVAYGCYIFGFMLNGAAIYSGGFDLFVCNGNKNYFVALDQFSDSSSSVIFYALLNFFDNLAFSHWALFSFNLFCHSMRPHTLFFEKFIRQPVNPHIILLAEGWCICSSIAIFVVCVVLGPNGYFYPLPAYGFPFPLNGPMRAVYIYPLGFYEAVSGVLLVCAIFLIMRRGRHIFYFQWRSLIPGLFWLTFLILLIIMMLLPKNSPFNQSVLDDVVDLNYIGCVASHPQKSPPPCQRESLKPYFDLLLALILATVVMTLLAITFWTNTLIIYWWKELIFRGKLLLEPPLPHPQSPTSPEEELLINRD